MFSRFSTSHSRYFYSKSGFGLIELLVSISIMVIVVSIVLVRQSSFNGAVLLRSQAYEIALDLRDVQLTAVSATAEADVGNFRSILGVHFDTNNPDTYRIYRDTDATVDYYHEANEEFGLQGLMDNRFVISNITDSSSNSHTALSVVFERPDFDARFFTGPGTLNELTVSSVYVEVARRGATGSGSGDVRTIEITSAGQISVQ